MIKQNNKIIKIMAAIIVILFSCYAVYHLCKIGEKKFLELVESSADEEREKRHEETSVKKEIHTDNGDIFVIDLYMDPFTIENMMDVYQKADEEEKEKLIKYSREVLEFYGIGY